MLLGVQWMDSRMWDVLVVMLKRGGNSQRGKQRRRGRVSDNIKRWWIWMYDMMHDLFVAVGNVWLIHSFG
jgi:hypothetical protein